MITYVDTSVLLRLLVDDEAVTDAAERLWLESTYVVCAEIGYAEARAALASMHRNGRLDDGSLRTARVQLDALWEQIDVVAVTTEIVHAAGDLFGGLCDDAIDVWWFGKHRPFGVCEAERSRQWRPGEADRVERGSHCANSVPEARTSRRRDSSIQTTTSVAGEKLNSAG